MNLLINRRTYSGEFVASITYEHASLPNSPISNRNALDEPWSTGSHWTKINKTQMGKKNLSNSKTVQKGNCYKHTKQSIKQTKGFSVGVYRIVYGFWFKKKREKKKERNKRKEKEGRKAKSCKITWFSLIHSFLSALLPFFWLLISFGWRFGGWIFHYEFIS